MKRLQIIVSLLMFAFVANSQSLTPSGNIKIDPYPFVTQSSTKATRWVWDSTLFSSYMDTKTGKKWADQRDEVFNPTIIIEMRKNIVTGALEKYDSIVQHFYGPDLLQSMEKYPWCSDGWRDTIQYEAYTQDQKATVKMGKTYSRYYCKVYSGTKNLYSYYDDGSLYTNLLFVLDTINMVWVKSDQTFYFYNEHGDIDSTVIQKWNEVNNTWENYFISSYNYDSQNRVTQVRTQRVDENGQLKDTLFTYYIYSGLETYVTYQVWDAVRNNWQDVSREVYIYSNTIINGDTLLIEYYTQEYNAGAWDNVEDFLYEYDSLKRIITKTGRRWSTSDNQWTDSARVRYEYNENNLLGRYYQDAWFGSSWGNTYNETYYYSQVQYNALSEWSNGIEIYPNPATDYVRITGVPDGLVKIYNLSGQLIYQSRLAGDLMNISHLQPGVYILKVSDNNNNQTNLRLIKQ